MNHVVTQRTGPLVLDAGHGGEDGGAVSITGVPESRINLSIVLSLRDVLGLYGVDPILLREEDISLHDSSAATLREKKRSDLKTGWQSLRRWRGDSAQYPSEYLPRQPLPRGPRLLRPHRRLSGTGGARSEQHKSRPPARQRAGCKADSRYSLHHEPRHLPRRPHRVRLPHQSRGGGPASGRGLPAQALRRHRRRLADGRGVSIYIPVKICYNGSIIQ